MTTIEPNDYFKYFDPSPVLEQDTLNRVQMQIDLIPSIEKISSCIERMALHLGVIEEDVRNLTSSFDSLNLPPVFKKAYSTFGSMFSYFGKSLIDQCNLNVNVFKTILLPSLINQRNDFNKSNSEFQRIIEEYGNLNPKSKIEVFAIQEQCLQYSMQSRADSFFALSQSLFTAEKAAIPAAKLALSTFLNSISRSMNEYVSENAPNLEKILEDVNSWQSAVKDALKITPSKNSAGTYAQNCWDVRQGLIKPTPNLIHASGIMWLRNHRLVTTWSRKYVTFEKGILTFYEPTTGAREQTIPLALITVTEYESSKRRFCFKIQSPQNMIRLQALTKFDQQEWNEIFTEHNSQILQGPEAASNDAKHICADCGSNDATWCSLNWCTYLCLKCSGVHRQMSSTKSKVRSTILDKLHPLIQDMLILMTNNAANSLLLTKKADMEVDPRMDDQLRNIYIARKYQRMDWKTDKETPNPFEAILNLDYFALFHAMNFDKNEQLYESLTPLHAAAAGGNAMITTIAACCSQSIDPLDDNGWTPLSYAVYYDNLDVARFLVDFGAQPSAANMDLFTLAVAVGNEDMMTLILKTAKYIPGTNSFKPKTTAFAPNKKVDLLQITVSQETKDLANLLYKAEHPSK
ncbi:ARF GAP-like zinc finger-containing protein [Tritrichomonas foetus]|uniref:ARF GAP-like zinc finger-containing protein n=1 Tax=Tritrichomonas foetus TaxID=1144522 RepID=A0A1J4KIU4_9EUKA|nr:ARF GAP-like zinc finger-containing protein [Tritrichomonas foetus]|eukprot:OHT11273.1 ARF GAP-like zinc finger-containing protein [Tritrichomonas foetus]